MKYLAKPGPKAVVLENVAGSQKKGRTQSPESPFETINTQLSKLKHYEFKVVSLSAADMNLPQARPRMWWILVRNDMLDEAGKATALDNIVAKIEACKSKCTQTIHNFVLGRSHPMVQKMFIDAALATTNNKTPAKRKKWKDEHNLLRKVGGFPKFGTPDGSPVSSTMPEEVKSLVHSPWATF